MQKDMKKIWGKTKKFLDNSDKNKQFQVILILVMILFSAYLSFNLRNYPAELPITDTWAEQTLSSNLKSQIAVQVESENPYLPDASKEELVNERYQEYLNSAEGAQLDSQINLLSQQFKDQLQDEEGNTYLLAIDPYYFYRNTENLIKTGHLWTEERNGLYYDGYVLAPKGLIKDSKFGGASFHEWFSATVYKITSFFNKNESLMHTFFYIPIIISLLAVIPAFFIVKELGGGKIGGFVSSLLVAIHPDFLTRTVGGFSDTDAYNVTLPLFAVWTFILGLKSNKLNSKIIFGILTGAIIGLYSFAWGGWWYIFDILLAVLVIYFILKLVQDKKHFWKQQKSNLLFSGSFILISASVVSIFKGIMGFFNFIVSPFGFLFLKESVKSDLWPNVYTTVAELNEVSMKTVISNIGGTLFLILALLIPIMFLIVWIKDQLINKIDKTKTTNSKINLINPLLILIWIAVTLFTTTQGTRFTLVVVPAICVGFGYSIGWIIRKITEYSNKNWNINTKISSIVMLLLIILLFITPQYTRAKNVALNEIPSMNDAWYNTLTKIKYESETDAIINSWWDFGHQFKAIADRRVTFDGGVQNNPQAHWIGRVLLTEDENEAMGILRMLDCSANDAFTKLKSITNDTTESIDILRQVQVLDRKQAYTIYKNKFGTEKADELIELTHCEDVPEDYFITSEDMVGKASVWAHFGSWNFEKAEISNYVKTKSKEEAINLMVNKYGKTYNDAEIVYNQLKVYDSTQINNWVSSWPTYYGEGNCEINENSNNMSCILSIQGQQVSGVFDMQKTDFTISTTVGKLHPDSVVYESVVGVSEKEYQQTAQEKQIFPFSVAIYQDSQGTIRNVVMAPELSTSTFTKLFYYGGKGLEHFELFDSQRQLTGDWIYVWKVNW